MPDLQEIKTPENTGNSQSASHISDMPAVPVPHHAQRYGGAYWLLFAFFMLVGGGLAYGYFHKKTTLLPITSAPKVIPSTLTVQLSPKKIGELQKLDASSTLGFTKILSFNSMGETALPHAYEIFILPNQKNLKTQKIVYQDKTQGFYINFIVPGQSAEAVGKAYSAMLGAAIVNARTEGAVSRIEAKNNDWKAKILYFSNNGKDSIISVEIIPL